MGWIKLHTKITEWEWYDNIPCRLVFLHLLLNANYEDKTWKGIMIKRGQHLTSIQSLANETGLSVSQVRTAINNMQATNELTLKTTNKYTVITIEKYEEYQHNPNSGNKQTNTQNATQKTTPKEEQKKEGKKDICSAKLDKKFDEFYNQAYPRKGSPKEAEKAFAKAVKDGASPDELIIGARNYATAMRGIEKKFIKLPATWLNKGCWEDEHSTTTDYGR